MSKADPVGGSTGLRMIVCIKQVPKAEEIQIDPETQTLKRVGVPSEINPPDKHAIEMALQLREEHGGTLTVLSMGPPVFRQSLEEAVGMGADRGILLSDRKLGASDTVPTGYALSESIKKIGGFDIIFCGEETTDSSTGHVGPGIAGHLEIPQLTYVSEVKVEGRTLRAKRVVEDGLEWWECSMPALVTVNFGCNVPREPTLLNKIRAKREGTIATWSADDVGLDPSKIGLQGSPTVVEKVETVELPPRRGKILKGEARSAVLSVIDLLEKDGFLGEG